MAYKNLIINLILYVSFSLVLAACGGGSNNSIDETSINLPTIEPTPEATATPLDTATPSPTLTPSPTPTPQVTAIPSQIVEAETASLFWDQSSGLPQEIQPQIFADGAASGGQGIAWISFMGSGAEFVNVPAARSLTVRYASLQTGEISVYVNGENQGNIRFTAGTAWVGDYLEASINVETQIGDTVTIQVDPSDFAMNIDYLAFNPEPMDIIPISTPSPIVDGPNKFEPEGDKVIVFIGQDNEGVGGNSSIETPTINWDQGYLDAGLPKTAGVTSYIGLTDRSNDPEYNVPDGLTIAGLNNTFDFNAGPICLRCYLESSEFDLNNFVVHLAIFFSDDPLHARRVANGENDEQIQELADFILEFSHIPFFIRPGFEFDVIYRGFGVSAEDYIGAYKRIVDGIRTTGAENFVILFSGGYSSTPSHFWHEYYPGEDYADWIAYSHFEYGVPNPNEGVFSFARNRDKPIMIAESTPRARDINEDNGQQIWDEFFANVFTTIDSHPGLIKAYHYINTDWRTHSLWSEGDPFGFGATDSRIQESSTITNLWINQLMDPKYILAEDDVFGTINFIP